MEKQNLPGRTMLAIPGIGRFISGVIVLFSLVLSIGITMSPAKAVEIWQGDSLHQTTKLSPNYTDVGAGMSSDRSVADITLDDGTVSGQAGTAATQPPPAQSASPTSSASPPAGQTSKGFVVAPVITVTAQPDGSIIHIVQPGEVLLNIALAYNVKLNDLYQLNFLTAQSVIYPGQKIKIKGPDPTATPTETSTPTRAPTATRRPTRTPAPSPTLTPTTLVTSTSPVTPNTAATSSPDILLIVIGVMLVVGIGLVAAGSLLKRK